MNVASYKSASWVPLLVHGPTVVERHKLDEEFAFPAGRVHSQLEVFESSLRVLVLSRPLAACSKLPLTL